MDNNPTDPNMTPDPMQNPDMPAGEPMPETPAEPAPETPADEPAA